MDYERGLGMPKRERIKFCERGEERREHVMKHKRRHVKISQLFYATLINSRVFIFIVENFDYIFTKKKTLTTSVICLLYKLKFIVYRSKF